jgi:hypothetical protein
LMAAVVGRCWLEGSNWTPVVVGNRSAVPEGRRLMAAVAGSWRTVPEAPVVVGMPPPSAAAGSCCLAMGTAD